MATVQDSDEEVQHKKKAKGHRIIDSGKNVYKASYPQKPHQIELLFLVIVAATFDLLLFGLLNSYTSDISDDN